MNEELDEKAANYDDVKISILTRLKNELPKPKDNEELLTTGDLRLNTNP